MDGRSKSYLEGTGNGGQDVVRARWKRIFKS